MRHLIPASLVAVAASVLALACSHAGTRATTDTKEQRTTVTGSRVLRQQDSTGSCFPDSASPVVVYPREALLQGWTLGNIAMALQHANPGAPCAPPERRDDKK